MPENETLTASEETSLLPQQDDIPAIVYAQEISRIKYIITCIFRTYTLQIICATPGAFLSFLGGAGIKPDSLHSFSDLKSAIERTTTSKIALGSLGLGAAFAVNASINIIFMESSFFNMANSFSKRQLSMLIAAFWAAGGVIANAQMSADAFNFIGPWKYLPFGLTWLSFFATRFNGMSSIIASNKQQRFKALVLQYLQMNNIRGQIDIQLAERDANQPMSLDDRRSITNAIISLVRQSGFNSSRMNKWSWAQSTAAVVPSTAYFGMLTKLGAQGLFSLAQKKLPVSKAAIYLPTLGVFSQIPAIFFTTRSVSKFVSALTDYMISLYQNSRNRSVTKRIGWGFSILCAGAMSYFSSNGVSAEVNELISEDWLRFLGITENSFGADFTIYGSVISIALINFYGLLELINQRMHRPQNFTIDREACIYYLMTGEIDCDMLFNELNGANTMAIADAADP